MTKRKLLNTVIKKKITQVMRMTMSSQIVIRVVVMITNKDNKIQKPFGSLFSNPNG